MLSEEFKSSNLSPFAVSFATRKGSLNGQEASVRSTGNIEHGRK